MPNYEFECCCCEHRFVRLLLLSELAEAQYDRRVVEALIINDKAVGHTRHRMTKRQSRSRQPAGNVPLTFTIVPGSL